MRNSLEILVLRSRQIAKIDATITIERVFLPTIDGYPMAALRQADRAFFGKHLESAVIGRGVARSLESNTHQAGVKRNQPKSASSVARRRCVMRRCGAFSRARGQARASKTKARREEKKSSRQPATTTTSRQVISEPTAAVERPSHIFDTEQPAIF